MRNTDTSTGGAHDPVGRDPVTDAAAQTGKRRRKKKGSARDGLRQVVTDAERRLRRVRVDHRHPNLRCSLRRRRRSTLTEAKGPAKTSKGVRRSRCASSAAHALRGLHPLWISISGCPNTAWLGKPIREDDLEVHEDEEIGG